MSWRFCSICSVGLIEGLFKKKLLTLVCLIRIWRIWSVLNVPIIQEWSINCSSVDQKRPPNNFSFPFFLDNIKYRGDFFILIKIQPIGVLTIFNVDMPTSIGFVRHHLWIPLQIFKSIEVQLLFVQCLIERHIKVRFLAYHCSFMDIVASRKSNS